MKIKYILGLIIFYSTNLFAQNTFKAIIKNEKTKETLASVALFVVNYQNSSTSDENGFVTIENIPNAKQTFVFDLIGYRKKEKSFEFPQNETIEVFLEPNAEEVEEVIITSSTRSSRTIKNIPTRIEAIASIVYFLVLV